MATRYSVKFVNKSGRSGNVAIFRDPGDMPNEPPLPLAWLWSDAKNGSAQLEWTDDLNFVWGKFTGPYSRLLPGETFSAAQVLPADLSRSNQITLTYYDGRLQLRDQRTGPKAGSLFVTIDGTVPAGQGAVGIGMSGLASLVADAKPSYNMVFTPTAKVWIVFGDIQKGEALDYFELRGRRQLEFPPNATSLNAVLKPHGWEFTD